MNIDRIRILGPLTEFDTHERPLVLMSRAYLLWFFLCITGAHLLYARRWGFAVFHYIVVAILLIVAYLSWTTYNVEALIRVYVGWIVCTVLEGSVLWHQVRDTNERARARDLQSGRGV